MHTLLHGLFIAIEGIDGSGKSTLAKNLHELLTQKKYHSLLTRQPGGTELGKKLRTLLQHQDTPLNPKAEYLLFAADRAQHMSEIIKPYIEQKYIVISDRMADSSIAYQGFARGLSIELITQINSWALDNTYPDITIFVHIPVDIAFERLHKRNIAISAFEKKEFLQKVSDGFTQIYAQKNNVIQLDGMQNEHLLAQNALAQIEQWIQKNKVLKQ